MLSSKIRKSLIESAALASVLFALAPATYSVAEQADNDRYLLLSNGKVRVGQVYETSEGYLLEREGGIIPFPVHKVAHVADSIKKLYEYRTSRIPPNDFEARFDLYRWCIEQGGDLEQEAVRELQLILEYDPENSRVLGILKRMNQRHQNLSTSPSHPPRQPQVLPIDPALYLKRFEEGYGKELMRTYTHRLENLLLNRCGSCHASIHHKGKFLLYQRGGGKPNDQPLTARNLQSVLAMIDSQNPERSPLLYFAIREHGHRGEKPLGGINDPKYKDLRDWVFRIASSTEMDDDLLTEQPIPSGRPRRQEGFGSARDIQDEHEPPPSSIYYRPRKPANISGLQPPASSLQSPAWPGYRQAADDAPERRSVRFQPVPMPTIPHSAIRNPQSKDPFDPTIFNRNLGENDRSSITNSQ